MSGRVLGLVVLLILAVIGLRMVFAVVARQVVGESQVGLLYRNGRFVRRLPPGAYWLLRFRSRVTLVDVRRRTAVVPGQEVLTRDNVPVRETLVLTFEVSDPDTALHRVESYHDALYAAAQLALRAAVAVRTVDELLERRADLGRELVGQVSGEATAIGLTVHLAEVRDFTFPPEIRKAFAEVVRARQEGQAALERARGETAALRNLANAAKLMDDNPSLLSLRLLQALSAGGAAGPAPTIVLGVPQGFAPLRPNGSSVPKREI